MDRMSTTHDDRRALACDLSALNPSERARRSVVASELSRLSVGREDLPDGYGFRYTADSSTLMKIAEFVSMERLCCPFLNFTIEVESANASIRLRLSGGDGVKQFIASELGIKA